MDITNTVPVALSVSQLNQLVGELLAQLGEVQVEGEVTNFIASAAGHWYFALKDEHAQVACAMFGVGKYQRRAVANGDLITVTAKPGIYMVRGRFQLVVSNYRPSGQGRLLRQIVELQHTLAQQGLFDASHKLPVPEQCHTIGVITSASAAALSDIITASKRRSPATRLFVYPCQVQGDGAAESIIRAIELAQQHNECEALIIGRGGGSLEDLMAYNDEALVRAVYSCSLPTVSAVGHERDFSLLDLVADARAATPTAAAERLTEDSQVMAQRWDEAGARLARQMQQRLAQARWQLEQLQARLQHPKSRIEHALQQLEQLHLRLQAQITHRLEHAENHLLNLSGQLTQLNPDQVLQRGYTLVMDAKGKVIASSKAAQTHEEVQIRFTDGKIRAKPLSNAC